MPNKKNIIIAAPVLLVILLIAIYFYAKYSREDVSIGGHVFSVEVVTTEADMQKGLGDRANLCKTCGMLFQFARSGKYGFWMKDMRFPLDILWISQGKITHIEKNIEPTFGAVMTPAQDAERVLEINAGNVDRYGFKIGDSVL